MEIAWRDVVGYEGIYEVSSDGQVRTKEGKVTYSERHGKRVWKSRILKEKNKKGRDVRVELYKDKKSKSWLVHRLVAIAFIPNVDETLTFINHIDGNPRNNNVTNLEWCNHYINNNHAFDNGLIKTAHKIKLTNISSGEEFIFRSKSKASEFLSNNFWLISGLLKNGVYEYEGYKIEQIQ